MKAKTSFGTYEVEVMRETYIQNKNTCMQLYDVEGMPFATLTVNIDELPKDYACIDTNNCPWAERFMKENDLGTPTDLRMRSGFCTYPVYRLNLDKIPEFDLEEVSPSA